MNLFLVCCLVVLLAFGGAAMAADVGVSNGLLDLRCDPASGQFSIKPPAGQSAISGTLPGGGGSAKIVAARDKAFGDGQCIELSHPDGSVDRMMVFPGLPFALFRATIRNAATQPAVRNKLPALDAVVDLGKPASALRALGTGGLVTLDKKPGSYMWLAIADPATGRGVVGGWITTDRGSGVVFAEADGDRAKLRAQVEYGKLPIVAGATAELETFAIGCFDDARLGMEAWADAVAKVYDIHLPPQPVGYCTWYHAGSWNEKGVAQQAAFAGENLAPFGFSVVQIDDGWQDGQTKNGPKKNFTRIREKGPYASGMKATADAIRSRGLVPGIWLMPFSGSHEDPWYKDHQDWFVRKDDGSPHESPWGGTCLDMTHPGAREYLRDEIHRIVDEWGYRYLKMDGLCSGVGVRHVYVNDGYRDDGLGDGVFHDPAKTNIEAFRDGLKLVRDAAGRQTYVLGCTVAQNMRAYGGAMGLVDAMRIGPDNNPGWDHLVIGPRYGVRHYHLNGRIWHNDPDCIYARPQVPLNQARLIASWVTISGQLSISSEDFAKLPPDRLDLLKRTMPSHALPARPVDLFDSPMPRIWIVTDARGDAPRHVVGLYNWADQPATIECALARLGLDAGRTYAAFDYWDNTALPAVNGELRQTVPGR